MYFIEIVLFVVGLILLVAGYRRNHRNLLLCAAITLFLSTTLVSAMSAFREGYTEARSTR
jgi:hypothetical protein